MSHDERFQQLTALSWTQTFHDSCTGNWQDRWFLDGQRATVRNSPMGMVLSAGPIPGDDGSHCVLWTDTFFAGDVKIENFDYWRLDSIQQYVNIIYILATGTGDAPYVHDIAAWSPLREIPSMSTYHNHMQLLHVSFAAFGAQASEGDYVRARRYPVTADRSFGELDLPPDNFDTGLFTPREKHRFTIIKHGDTLLMRIVTADKTALFGWDTSAFDSITEGRIGLRHMWTRCARYADVDGVDAGPTMNAANLAGRW